MTSLRWEERALAAVTGRRKRGRRGRRPGFVFTPSEFDTALIRAHITFSPEYLRLLDLACQKRNVNRSTYIRRAVAVLLSADLDLPVPDILWHSPTPGPYGGLASFDQRGKRDNAVGMADWCGHPGCDGSHLRREGGA